MRIGSSFLTISPGQSRRTLAVKTTTQDARSRFCTASPQESQIDGLVELCISSDDQSILCTALISESIRLFHLVPNIMPSWNAFSSAISHTVSQVNYGRSNGNIVRLCDSSNMRLWCFYASSCTINPPAGVRNRATPHQTFVIWMAIGGIVENKHHRS